MDTPVSDLSPLTRSHLKALLCSRSGVRDLSPLAGLPLTSLTAEQLGLRTLEPLRGMPLVELEVRGNQIEDISVLGSMTSQHWRALNLSESPVGELAPLRGAHGDKLGLSRTGIRDISVLSQTRFRHYSLDNNPISDLTPLTSTGLRSLAVVEILPVRVRPLAGTAIRSLEIGGTPVLDLEALTRLRELAELQVMEAASPAQLAKLADRLEQFDRPKDLVAAVRVQAAAMAGDREALRSLATVVGKKRLVYVPTGFRFEEAKALAARLSARLPTIRSTAEAAALIALVPEPRLFWVDVTFQGQSWRWPDGSAFATTLVKGFPPVPAEPGRGCFVQRWGDGLKLQTHPAWASTGWAYVVLEFD